MVGGELLALLTVEPIGPKSHHAIVYPANPDFTLHLSPPPAPPAPIHSPPQNNSEIFRDYFGKVIP